MADLPENYVTLLQLRERWYKRQQEEQEGRKPESLSGKGREGEEHWAGDIVDQRRPRYWCRNKDGGGGEGRGPRGMAVPVAEGSAREWYCPGRSESKIGSRTAAPEDGRKLSREKEIVESSCFASAVVEDSSGKEVKSGDRRLKSSDQGGRSFKKPGSGPFRAKEDEAQGKWPRPYGRNDVGGRDDGDNRRYRAAPAAESGALERPSSRRSATDVRLGAQKSTIPPEEGEGIIESVCFVSAVVEESGGKEAKSKSRGKNEKEAGVVRAEEGQGRGNWQREFQRNDDGRGDVRSHREVVAPVKEIVALGRQGPRRSDSEVVLGGRSLTSVPENGLDSPPAKELVGSVCFTGGLVEEGSAKEMKSKEYEKKSGGSCSSRQCDKERKISGVVKGKEEKDLVDNIANDGHYSPADTVKDGCRGNEMKSMEDLKRSNKYRWRGHEKKKSGVAQIRGEEEEVDKLADGHNMPLEAVTLPGRKESVQLEGKYLGVNGRVISGPRMNSLPYRAKVVVREDIEIQEDFAGNKKEAVSKVVEPANESSGTKGKLGDKQKNDISGKEMVFCSDEGEVTRKLREVSIGSTSSRRRRARKERSRPRAENSRSWSRGHSKGENGVLASRMERDMVWVKKGDVLGGNNVDGVTRPR